MAFTPDIERSLVFRPETDVTERARGVTLRIPRILKRFDPAFAEPFCQNTTETFDATERVITAYLAEAGEELDAVVISARDYIANAGIPLATASITASRKTEENPRGLTPIAGPLMIGAKLNKYPGTPVENVGFLSGGEVWRALSHEFQFRLIMAAQQPGYSSGTMARNGKTVWAPKGSTLAFRMPILDRGKLAHQTRISAPDVISMGSSWMEDENKTHVLPNVDVFAFGFASDEEAAKRAGAILG